MFSSKQNQTWNISSLLIFLKDYISAGPYRNIQKNFLFWITVSVQQKSDIGLTQSLGSTSRLWQWQMGLWAIQTSVSFHVWIIIKVTQGHNRRWFRNWMKLWSTRSNIPSKILNINNDKSSWLSKIWFKIQDTFKLLFASYQADIRQQCYQPRAIN